tara:strand:- start:263 stop:1225 length:963 start_codon:yes stop_codon:yes gene_type:complete
MIVPIKNNLFNLDEKPMMKLLAQSTKETSSWVDSLIVQLNQMVDEFTAFIPKLLTAFILLLVGVIISTIVARGTRFLLEKFGGLLKEKFANSPIIQRSGFSGIFVRANTHVPFSIIVSKSLFWILIIMFLSSAARSLGLEQISAPLSGLVSFLPQAITALIISVAGFIIGDLVRGFVVNGAKKVGLDYAGALANLVYAFILVLVLTIAIDTLGVDTTLIRHTVEILLLGAAVATSLALGLGMRPLAQNIVSGVYARDLYPVGTKIRFKGNEELEGKVVSVGPVTTQIETSSNNSINIPNSSIVAEIVEAEKNKTIQPSDS